MLLREIEDLVATTEDAAFAVDGSGLIVAWNAGCVALFGRSARDAVGCACGPILEGTDASGPVCSAACCVLTACQLGRPMKNFDLSVATATGRRWCNVSVIRVKRRGEAAPVSIHILRDVDTRKRLDVLMREFVATGAAGPLTRAIPPADVERNAARVVELTRQEAAVLRLLAAGSTTVDIASDGDARESRC